MSITAATVYGTILCTTGTPPVTEVVTLQCDHAERVRRFTAVELQNVQIEPRHFLSENPTRRALTDYIGVWLAREMAGMSQDCGCWPPELLRMWFASERGRETW